MRSTPPARAGTVRSWRSTAAPFQPTSSRASSSDTCAAHSRGRTRREPGLFVKASGGTLLLDEIGEMPLEMQTKLLRALQERKIRPVGSNEERSFDARILAATNRDLEAEVAAKRFREDLFYRINVVKIEVPSLRARGGDILALATHFLRKASREGEEGRDVPLARRLPRRSSPTTGRGTFASWRTASSAP